MATYPVARSKARDAVRPTTPVVLSAQAGLNFGGVEPGSSGPDITPPLGGGPPGISFNGGISINPAPADATVTGSRTFSLRIMFQDFPQAV